jgi:flagellar hook-basal body complex protein FliE
MAITAIGTPAAAALSTLQPRSEAATGAGFSDLLTKMVDKVESSHAGANDAVSKMLDGTGDVHEAMIALQTSDLDFQLAVQVRNKFVQAYQEIMRMPI